MNGRRVAAILLLASLLAAPPVAGCLKPTGKTGTLTLATTTSTRDSGLLDVLVPMFERQTGIKVKVIAVGSGQALELGRRGDADVLLTHAPEAERRFMDEGHGQELRSVMYNDFVLVGPRSDPAGIVGTTSIKDAFQGIARTESSFVSRGDDSGTHMKERTIWDEAGIRPKSPWYIESGAGMAEALRMADQLRAHTLSDRATFLAQQGRLELAILAEGDPLLRNPYSVIVVRPRNDARDRVEAARRFADFLLSPSAQEAIGEFGVQQFGQPLFFLAWPAVHSALGIDVTRPATPRLVVTDDEQRPLAGARVRWFGPKTTWPDPPAPETQWTTDDAGMAVAQRLRPSGVPEFPWSESYRIEKDGYLFFAWAFPTPCRSVFARLVPGTIASRPRVA